MTTDTQTHAATTANPRGGLLATARERAKNLPISELGMLPVLVIVIIVGSVLNSNFMTHDNILTILQQSSEVSLVVIAETMILITKKFDLSLESTVGFAPMLAAWFVLPAAAGGQGVGLNPWLALLIMFAVGAAIGWLNGLLVVRLRLNAFIVTLAILILLRGATLGVANGRTLSGLPAPLTYLGANSFVGVPISVWIAIVMFIVTGVFLRYHRIGRALYAIGGSADAARAAGIRVNRIVWGTFVVGGLLAALAGLLFMGRLESVTATQGQNLMYTAIAAAVIGGVSLNGGRGSMIGAAAGVLLLGVISNLLTLSQISSFWIDASYGAIILAALLLQRLSGADSNND